MQTRQYPLVHLQHEWRRPAEKLHADILAATAHTVVSQGQFQAKSRPELSDTVGGWRQTERCQMAKNTWYGPPLGGRRPLKQWWSILTEPRTQTPGHRGPFVVCACAGTEGRCFGLKGPGKGGGALHLHQHPSVHFPREWKRPGERLYADILAATAHIVVSQGGILWPFLAKSRPEFSDTVGGWRQTERCQRVKNTWYGPPLGGLRPLKQWWSVLTEPRTQTPGQRGPSCVCLRSF